MDHRRFVLVLALGAGAAGCPGINAPADAADASMDTPATDGAADAPADIAPRPSFILSEGCDPLVPSHCGLPFPSDTWRVADTAAPRGHRLIFGERTLPQSRLGVRTAPDVLRHHDGFSPAAGAFTHMPGATVTGLASSVNIPRSLEADSPTVLIEADTGARVAHWAELDMHSNTAATRAFMLRPATRLRDATRYIVALRNVANAAGEALAPSDAFRALRDNGTYDADPSIAARRAHYETLFARLASSGVPRGSLQLAWDFTTASRESNTEGMLAMRDPALAAVGADGPAYVLDSVTRDVNADVAVRIAGWITVPLYLDQPGPGGRATLDARGFPVQNGTAQYPFLIIVPRSAVVPGGPPAGLVQFGHGLFGSRTVIEGGDYERLANQYNYVFFALDWLGMSEPDPPFLAEAIQSGDLARIATLPDRGRQAFLNALLAMRMMTGALSRDPAVQAGGRCAYDPARRYYIGGSQGGIYGTTYMALTTDVERGVLAVPGQSYNLMLPRSILYDQFEVVLNTTVRDAIDAQLALAMTQTIWDRADPSGYSPYVTSNPLPGTPTHRVLVIAAVGDHEVPNVATHDLARTMGLRSLAPAVRPIFGIETAEGTFAGSAIVEEDFGLPPVPVENVPMRMGQDPHSRVLEVQATFTMAEEFLRTGAVTNRCTGTCNPD